MPLCVELVPAGRPAVAALDARLVELRGGDPLAPATVLVPRSWVGLSLRRLVAARSGGLANVRFTTFAGLAADLGGPTLAADGRVPLDGAALTAAVRAALRAEPGSFRAVAEHTATEAAVAAAWRLLRDAEADGLTRLAATGARQADLVRLVGDISQRLAGHFDDRDAAEAAAAVLHGGAHAAGSLGAVVAHLPGPPSAPHEALLAALASVAPLVVQVQLTSDPAVDAEARAFALRVGGRPAAEPTTAPAHAESRVTRVVSAPDADTEVLHALRDVAARLASGARLERIGIAYGPERPYAGLLLDACQAAGLDVVGATRRTLAQTLPGRVLLDGIELARGSWARSEVVAWLDAAELWHGGTPVDGVQADRLSREAGVTKGHQGWLDHLRAHAADSEVRAQTAHPEAERRIAHHRRQAESAGRLADVIEGLPALLDPAPAPTTWDAWAGWARRVLRTVTGSAPRRAAWPAHEQQAFAAVEAALDRLSQLDHLDPGPDRERFVRALHGELAGPAPDTARFGHGLVVGPYRHAVGLHLDILYVLGVADGAVPPRPSEDALLPDADRALAGAGVATLAGRSVEQRRDWCLALAAAPEVVLSFARGDQRNGREQRPARWWLDAAAGLVSSPGTLFAGDVEAPGFAAGHPAVQVVASWPAAQRGPGEPVSVADHDLRLLARWVEAGGRADRHWLAAPSTPLAEGLTARAHRRLGRYDRFEGKVRLVGVPSPVELDSLSPTRLEGYASCPRRYFLQHVLGVHAPERPEDLVEIDARSQGSIQHELLERFFRRQTELPEAERMAPGTRWSEADHRVLDHLADEVFARAEQHGLVGHPVLWAADAASLRRDAHRILQADDHHRARRGATPVAVEHHFGPEADADGPPVAVALADGRTLRFRGFVDRIDRTQDGRAVVLDYKRAGRKRYQELTADPVKRGQLLQLPIYGEAARTLLGVDAVEVGYWFIDPRGSLDPEVHPLDPPRFERFLSVVDSLVAGIEAGDFPARPVDPAPDGSTSSPCGFCDFERACQKRRARTWQAVRLDPSLARLVEVLDTPWPAVESPADDENESEAVA